MRIKQKAYNALKTSVATATVAALIGCVSYYSALGIKANRLYSHVSKSDGRYGVSIYDIQELSRRNPELGLQEFEAISENIYEKPTFTQGEYVKSKVRKAGLRGIEKAISSYYENE